MKNKTNHFTIVELMIAMGLMMLVVNILSQVYARISQHSLNMVSKKNVAINSEMVVNKIASDLTVARIDSSNSPDPLSGARNFRLLSSFASQNYTNSTDIRADDFLNDSNLEQTGSGYNPRGYPYLAFTAIDKTSTDSKILSDETDGYKEVAYWAVPSENYFDSSLGGQVGPSLLNLVRVEHKYKITDTGFKSLFEHDNFLYSTDNVILENLLWINYTFGQLADPLNVLRSYNNVTTVNSESQSTFAENSSSPYDKTDATPDYVDILISVLPGNESILFTTNGFSPGTHTHDLDDGKGIFYQSSTHVGTALNIEDDITFTDKKFHFPKEGHLWYKGANNNEGAVLYYYRHEDSIYVSVQTGYSSVTIPSDQELEIAIPHYKRVYLK